MCVLHQPGIIVNPACGKLNRENGITLSPFAPECFVLRVRFGRTVPHTQAESGAYLRDSTSPPSFPLRFPLEPPCANGLVPSLSGHAIPLPMAFTTENRHKASCSQGSSINGFFFSDNPMNQSIHAPLFP